MNFSEGSAWHIHWELSSDMVTRLLAVCKGEGGGRGERRTLGGDWLSPGHHSPERNTPVQISLLLDVEETE